MIPKLRIKLHESILCGKSSDAKSRATGYNHTYYDNEGLDLKALSYYPTDDEISNMAVEAADEADSLFILLGVHPNDLDERSSSTRLPSIAAWFGDADNELEGTGLEVNDAEEEEEDSTDVEKLQKIAPYLGDRLLTRNA